MALRIIADNDKQYDAGSDIARLRAAGVSIKVDGDERHMHHKFAVLDSHTLLSGSYNDFMLRAGGEAAAVAVVAAVAAAVGCAEQMPFPLC